MDNFKAQMNHIVGGAGIHCECCNCYHGKDKKLLNRMARKNLKIETRARIAEEI